MLNFTFLQAPAFEPTFNWIAIVLAALSTLLVGFIWYHPKVFGNAWMKSIGMTEEDAQKGNMPLIFGLSVVVAFFVALFLNVNIQSNFDPEAHATFKHGALHGFIVSFMVMMPVLVTNHLFERKSFKTIAINVGYWIVACMLMGGIISAWYKAAEAAS